MVAGDRVPVAQLHEGGPVAGPDGLRDLFHILGHRAEHERHRGYRSLTAQELPRGLHVVALLHLAQEPREIGDGRRTIWCVRTLQLSCGIDQRICDSFQSLRCGEHEAWFVSFGFVHCESPLVNAIMNQGNLIMIVVDGIEEAVVGWFKFRGKVGVVYSIDRVRNIMDADGMNVKEQDVLVEALQEQVDSFEEDDEDIPPVLVHSADWKEVLVREATGDFKT